MTTQELRNAFLSFYRDREHVLVESASLVPHDDPTLLFTGAGMNQFKPYFLDASGAPYTRATSCQKCFRTGDVDNVGRTPSHHTFFEMLGNFSFGDYFKREAIAWAYELVTDLLGFPAERLWYSVYKGDEEAFEIWSSIVPAERIHRLGEHDNFWPADAPTLGPDGPCGPCSEIFFDRGPEYGCGRPDCGITCDCHRYVEFYNLVFTQFDRQSDGTLQPLPQKNIDTGMGLERAAAILQGVPTNFETDELSALVAEAAELTGGRVGAGGRAESWLRLIADHIRASTFAVSDGVSPANEGRGYVIRKLIRRSVEHARRLGVSDVRLYRLVPVVARVMRAAYPELSEREEHISFVVKSEEERFLQVFDRALPALEDMLRRIVASGGSVVPGDVAFKFYDTYGLPVETLVDAAERQGLSVDRDGLTAHLEAQRERARAGSKMAGAVFASEVSGFSSLEPTRFVGYQVMASPASVVALAVDGEPVAEAAEGQAVSVALDRTPFYGEAGGQVGDTGLLVHEGGRIRVESTVRFGDVFVHEGRVEKGAVAQGVDLEARVDVDRRRATMRNHTATHLLQAALREVLGEHVEQRGSAVGPEGFRFDFTHFAAVDGRELAEVESLVNARVVEDIQLAVEVTSLEEARRRGAMALFGEKYGEKVRLVEVPGVSRELCGGTHVSSTGEIGLFLITGESSIAAGMRRIEGVTGGAAYSLAAGWRGALGELSHMLKSAPEDVVGRVEAQAERIRKLEKQLRAAQAQAARASAGDLLDDAVDMDGFRVLSVRLEGATRDSLRSTADSLKGRIGSGALHLAAEVDGKVALVVAVTDDLIKRGVKAGELAKAAAALVGGGGGGRPDMAQAGGTDLAKLDEMVRAFPDMVRERL